MTIKDLAIILIFIGIFSTGFIALIDEMNSVYIDENITDTDYSKFNVLEPIKGNATLSQEKFKSGEGDMEDESQGDTYPGFIRAATASFRLLYNIQGHLINMIAEGNAKVVMYTGINEAFIIALEVAVMITLMFGAIYAVMKIKF